MTGKHSSVHRWYQQAVREIDLTKHWGGGGRTSITCREMGGGSNATSGFIMVCYICDDLTFLEQICNKFFVNS